MIFFKTSLTSISFFINVENVIWVDYIISKIVNFKN